MPQMTRTQIQQSNRNVEGIVNDGEIVQRIRAGREAEVLIEAQTTVSQPRKCLCERRGVHRREHPAGGGSGNHDGYGIAAPRTELNYGPVKQTRSAGGWSAELGRI